MDFLSDCTYIKIEKHIHKTLGMNISAKELFEEINNSPNPNIVIDFTGIIAMGRSFAQEYVFQKHNSPIEIEEINMNESIEKILDVVEDDFKRSCLK